MRIDQVAVPVHMAKILTYPEKVRNPWDKSYSICVLRSFFLELNYTHDHIIFILMNIRLVYIFIYPFLLYLSIPVLFNVSFRWLRLTLTWYDSWSLMGLINILVPISYNKEIKHLKSKRSCDFNDNAVCL